MLGNNVLGILFAYVHEERVRDLTEMRVMASARTVAVTASSISRFRIWLIPASIRSASSQRQTISL